MERLIEAIGICVLIVSMPVAFVLARSVRARLAELAPFIVFIFAASLVYPFAIDNGRAAWRIVQMLGYAAWYIVCVRIPQRALDTLKRWFGAFVVISTLFEFAVTDSRPHALFYNAAPTASILAALAYAPWGAVWTLAALVALAATQTRGAIIAVSAAFALRYRPRLYILVALAIVALAIGALRDHNRFEIWHEAIMLFVAQPVVGWGPGCYALITHLPYVHAHNVIFSVAAEMGGVGLVGLTLAAFAAWRAGLCEAAFTSPGLLAILLHQLIDDTMAHYWVGIVFIALLAEAMNVRANQAHL